MICALASVERARAAAAALAVENVHVAVQARTVNLPCKYQTNLPNFLPLQFRTTGKRLNCALAAMDTRDIPGCAHEGGGEDPTACRTASC
eukprot:IDg11108t1